MGDVNLIQNLVYELKATVQSLQDRQKQIDTNVLSMVQSVSKLESNAINIYDQLKNNLKLIEHIQANDNTTCVQLSKLSQQLSHTFNQINEFKKISSKKHDEFEADLYNYNEKILLLSKNINSLAVHLEMSNKRIANVIKDSNKEITNLDTKLQEIRGPVMELTNYTKGIKFSQ